MSKETKMSEQRHTPEPWQFNGASSDGCPHNITATLSDGRYMAILQPVYDSVHHTDRSWWWPMCVASAARAVACVNAMAGIPDPAEFVARAKVAFSDFEKEERAHERTIGERDAAEEALSHAYYLVTGRSPEWSNHFGHKEANEEIDEAQATLRQTIATLTAERDAAAKAWDDEVPLAGPNRPKNDGSIEYLIGYLLTVRKRFGNTRITCDLQWGSEALHVLHREREEIKALTAERDAMREVLKRWQTAIGESRAYPEECGQLLRDTSVALTLSTPGDKA